MQSPRAADSPSPSVDGSGEGGFHNHAPWVNVVLGLLVFTLRYDSPRGTFNVHWNLFLTGIVIMFVALAATIAQGSEKNYWSALNVVAGAWLLVSVFTIPDVPRVAVLQVVLGALVIAVALVSLLTEIASQRRQARESAT